MLTPLILCAALAGAVDDEPLRVDQVFPLEHPDDVDWSTYRRELPHPTWRPPKSGVLYDGTKAWAWAGRVSGALAITGTALSVGSPDGLTTGLPVLGAGLVGGVVSSIGHSEWLRRESLRPNPNFLLAGLVCGGAALVARNSVGLLFVPYAIASPFVQLAANSLVIRRHKRATRRARPVDEPILESAASVR